MSPVLDALGSLAETRDNDIAYRTDTWAKSIPFGKSPPADTWKPIPFEKSPPSDLLDGDLPGGFSHPSSASPPPRTRPLSYGNGYLSSNRSRQQSADRQKSHSVSSPFNNQIPLPHLPQAHFYGAPDIDLPIHPTQNRFPADESYSFCAFDYIASSFKMSRMGGNVLLAGTDGALEVLAIDERKIRSIGKLSGLNGRVVDAKILNFCLQNDLFASSQPHIALIVHGPSQGDDEGHASSTGSDSNEIPAGLPGRHTSIDRRSDKDNARFYQTRAEVYSLRTGERITTLFTSKLTPCLETLPGLPQFAPSPVGSMRLYTSGNYIVLASGLSGEVYIYGIHPFSASNAYQCFGKTWTSVQTKEDRRYSTSSNSTDPDGSRNNSPHDAIASENPILSLKGRWLAVVPPSSTARTSIQGNVPAALVQGKVFGLETRSPPAKPAVTCATDVGDGESLFDKVARGVTQELVRGARWMGDQGLQAWNNYWNKDQLQGMAPRRATHAMDVPQQGYSIFPPTHSQDTQAGSTSEPDSVSILDLRRLEDGGETKNPLLNPVATFQVPNGCSFLSFSPSGLMLLTASKKGDVQYVWDLMQARHCRAGAFLSDDPTTQITNARRVARYARLTTSSIVDVIWSGPTGDRLAIITRKGTIHVFDMPRSAFQWPPFRRAPPPPRKVQSTDLPADELADRANNGNPLSAAIKLVGDKTQPIFSAVRGRAPSTGSGFPPAGGFSIPSAAGVRSGKVVAAGLSKSMGAASGTVNTLRHVGENRLHLSGLSRDPAASRVIWTAHKGQPSLGVIDGGFFREYRVRRGVSTGKSRQSQSVVGDKEVELKLPACLQSACGPIPVGTFGPEPTISACLALPTSNSQPAAASKAKYQPLSQAEIETNAPYQPCHTDQRVNLYILSPESETSSSMIDLPTDQWVFGDDISMSKLHVRPLSPSGDDDTHDAADEQAGYGDEMENLINLSNNAGHAEEIVITTRRKKKKSSGFTTNGMDDGFFEDDCEVLDFARDRV